MSCRDPSANPYSVPQPADWPNNHLPHDCAVLDQPVIAYLTPLFSDPKRTVGVPLSHSRRSPRQHSAQATEGYGLVIDLPKIDLLCSSGYVYVRQTSEVRTLEADERSSCHDELRPLILIPTQ